MIDPALKDDRPTVNGRTLRQFAGLWLLIFGFVAFSNAYFRQEPRAALVMAVVAASVGIPGLLWPSSIRLLFITALSVTAPIGHVVTYALLAALYYLLFTPIAILFRLLGRDALARRETTADTYWVEREQSSDPRRYFHQA